VKLESTVPEADLESDLPLSHFQWPHEAGSGRARVCFAGEIDLCNVHSLQEALAAHSAAGIGVLELDLREVNFLDGITMLVIAGAQREMKARGQQLIVYASQVVARFFRLGHLEWVLNSAG
jgi:anti-anti-sigma factor